MGERLVVALDQDGRIAGAFDESDQCFNGKCGGCGSCLVQQAVHYGYKLVDVELQPNETLADAVGRSKRKRV